MKKYGSLIVLSGPSGVGKSTLLRKVFAEMPELRFSVSCTTRPPRPGETDGVDYHFLSPEEFERRSQAGGFLEEARVFDRRYGTLRSEVVRHLEAGTDVVLDIDVQGARQIRAVTERDPEVRRSAVFVMIVPPSLAELEARLRGRKTESEEQLALRIAAAAGELASCRVYDYAVVNDDADRAAAELAGLFRSFALRISLIEEGEEPWLRKD